MDDVYLLEPSKLSGLCCVSKELQVVRWQSQLWDSGLRFQERRPAGGPAVRTAGTLAGGVLELGHVLCTYITSQSAMLKYLRWLKM